MNNNSAKQSAFTIVELLIVIVVIAILAAISIVAYNGIQERARASSVSSALSQAKKKIQVWQVDNPDVTPADLSSVGISNSNGVSYLYTPGSNGVYCITAINGNTIYKVSNSTSPSVGGCTITNMVTNPSFESNTTDWYAVNGGTISQNSAQKYVGSQSMRAATSTSTTYSGAGTACPGTIGKTYTYTAYVYSESSQSINFAADCLGIYTFATVSSGWQRVSVTGTRSNNNPMFVRAQSASGIPFYVDSVMYTEGSSIYNYADGNTSNWSWSGTANNSTSSGPVQ